LVCSLNTFIDYVKKIKTFIELCKKKNECNKSKWIIKIITTTIQLRRNRVSLLYSDIPIPSPFTGNATSFLSHSHLNFPFSNQLFITIPSFSFSSTQFRSKS
jgi:hypothetical protein